MTEEINEEPSQQSKRSWFLAGLYLGAFLLGWGGSFAGSQYVSRSLVLPDGAELDSFEKKEASEEPDTKTTSKTKNRIQSARPVDTYLQPLLNRSIFDSTQINTPVKIQEETDGSEPITDIDAQLLGTIVAIPAEYSLAMIKSGSAPWSKDYAVGDKLEDATVVEIKTREVIIRREDGRLEKLSLDKDESKDKKDGKSKDNSQQSLKMVFQNRATTNMLLIKKFWMNFSKTQKNSIHKFGQFPTRTLMETWMAIGFQGFDENRFL